MPKLAVILSKNPEGQFAAEFEDFLEKHFPLTSVCRQRYEQDVPLEAVVFVETYLPIPDFEDSAKTAAQDNHNVFVLSEGFSYSTADLISEGSRLHGLAGVVYKMRNEPFLALNKDGFVGSASEILRYYMR